MTTTQVDIDGKNYYVDYHINPATGPVAMIMRHPEYYTPAYVSDVKAFIKVRNQLVEISNTKMINKITDLLNREIERQ